MDSDDPEENVEIPVNRTPEIVQDAFASVVVFLQNYGWYLVILLIIIYYLKGKLEQKFHRWHSSRSHEVDLHRYDDGVVLTRQQAMEESRRRMQEQLNAQAAAYAEQQKKKEEEKRRQKVEDWERHLEGKGYKSKHRTPEENQAVAQPSTSSSQTKKTKYKADDYNPLSGGGGSCTYRPGRRGGAMGGGG